MSRKAFEIEKLALSLQQLPFIDFAFLFGSSSDGIIREDSDVDVAVYFSNACAANFDSFALVLKAIEDTVPTAKIDLIRLNTAGVFLRFEALKGRCLFIREKCYDGYAKFYSLTCREYEDYMFWMTKQLEYRRAKQ